MSSVNSPSNKRTNLNSKHNQEDRQQLFHEYLCEKIDSSDIKQNEMAAELGFAQPNIISMFKRGKTRVPLEKVPDFAKILGIDPKVMMRKAMLEYCPQLLREVENVFGTAVTRNELEILSEIRRLSNGKDPALTTIRQKEALEQFVFELIGKQQ